jgi:hypothetical protein
MGLGSLAVKGIKAVARREAEKAAEEAAARVVEKKVVRRVAPPKPKPKPPTLAVAPAIIGKASPGERVIAARAQQLEIKNPKKRLQPTGANPAFETTPEAYARTTDIVPQSTIEEAKGRIPILPEGDRGYPLAGRALPFIDRQEEVAQALAKRTAPLLGSNVESFYHTGPILEGLDRAGIDPAWMRNTFAPLYAGTSPRTPTVPNMLNASMLNYMREHGIPVDENTFDLRGNVPGYGMIGSHYGLADRLIRGVNDPMVNPKPSEFMPNVSGDLTGVTGDTHHIRGLVQTYNELYPGELPEDWLYKDARQKYRDTGTFNPALDVNDSLASTSRGGRKAQTEYGVMSGPTLRAAEINGVPGAAQQALQWFGFGKDTGLASPPKTFTEIFNDRLDVTGQALGIPPDEVLKKVATGEIPMMADGGPVRRGDFKVDMDIGRRR